MLGAKVESMQKLEAFKESSLDFQCDDDEDDDDNLMMLDCAYEKASAPVQMDFSSML